MRRIIATFTGKPGSLGYEHGKEYELILTTESWGVAIVRPDGTGKCKYSCVETFLDNWEKVSKIEKGSQ